ncbi:retrovirus-related pol polyprotein from transposon TNT 1-94 [Tanacetum coccineum]
MVKDNMEPNHNKLLNKRTAQSSYIKPTQEEVLVLSDYSRTCKSKYDPHDPLLGLPLESQKQDNSDSICVMQTWDNLFSVGKFCDSNLEVAFRQHTCFIRNLEGVDLLTGSRGDNLYTLSLGNMMASSPICLLSKASKTKSWLWHRRLSHLNFGSINHLARHGLVRGLPKLKFEKDHLCSACVLGKSSKKPPKPNLKTPIRKNSTYCIWIFVGQCVSRVSVERSRIKGKPYDEQKTDNGTEFVNQTLREYYVKVAISHETQLHALHKQNGVLKNDDNSYAN